MYLGIPQLEVQAWTIFVKVLKDFDGCYLGIKGVGVLQFFVPHFIDGLEDEVSAVFVGWNVKSTIIPLVCMFHFSFMDFGIFGIYLDVGSVEEKLQ